MIEMVAAFHDVVKGAERSDLSGGTATFWVQCSDGVAFSSDHMLALRELGDIFLVQRQPFAIRPLRCKPPVPVHTNIINIVNSNFVKHLRFVWKLDSQLSIASGRIAARLNPGADPLCTLSASPAGYLELLHAERSAAGHTRRSSQSGCRGRRRIDRRGGTAVKPSLARAFGDSSGRARELEDRQDARS